MLVHQRPLQAAFLNKAVPSASCLNQDVGRLQPGDPPEDCHVRQLSGKSQNLRVPLGQWEAWHGLTSNTETREILIHP